MPRPARAVRYALLGAMLIRACNPMVCPIPCFRRSVHFDQASGQSSIVAEYGKLAATVLWLCCGFGCGCAVTVTLR